MNVVRFAEVLEEIIEVPAFDFWRVDSDEEVEDNKSNTPEKQACTSLRPCPCLGPAKCSGLLEVSSPSVAKLKPGVQRRIFILESGCLQCFQDDVALHSVEGAMKDFFLSFVREPCMVEKDEDNSLGFSIRPRSGGWLNENFGCSGGTCILKFVVPDYGAERDAWVASIEAHISFARSFFGDGYTQCTPSIEKESLVVTHEALGGIQRPTVSECGKGASSLRDLPKSGYAYAGETQKGWGPEWWGITVGQLEEIRSLPGYRSGMNGRDLVTEVIKPQTGGKGMGYALMTNQQQPLRVTNMVSHCWDESFDHFVEAVKKAPNADTGVFWICFVAQYQNEDGEGPSISAQLGQKFGCDPDESLRFSSFSTVLKCIKDQQQCMYSVQTPEVNIYERMWCIYEMRTCMTYGLDVQMLMWEELDMRLSDVGRDRAVVPEIRFAAFARKPINTRTARCGPPVDKHGKITPTGKDEKMIRGIIEKTIGSYEEIDRLIEVMRAMELAASSIRPGSVLFNDHAAKLFKDKAKQVEMIWIRAHPKIPVSPYWKPFQHLVQEAKQEIHEICQRSLSSLHAGNHDKCTLGRFYHHLRSDENVKRYNTYVEHITGEPLVQDCDRDEIWYREFDNLRVACAAEDWQDLFQQETQADPSVDAEDLEILVKGRIIERYGIRLNAKDMSSY